MKKSILCIALFSIFILSGCEKNITYSYTKNDNSHSESNINSSSESITQSQSNKETTVTTIEEDFNSYKNRNVNIVSNGKGSVVIDGNKAYLDGKEISLDSSKGVSISYDNDKVLLNGKPVQYKDNPDSKKINNEEIQLTGKTIKVPLNEFSGIHSSLPIVQNCSNNRERYLLIDTALEPYLSKRASTGFIHLENGHYKIKGKLEVQIFTPSISYLENEGSGDLSIRCIEKNFTLINSGMSTIYLQDIDNDSLKITQNGIGKIIVDGTQVKKFYGYNKGVGSMELNVPILEGYLENFGVGHIKAKRIDSLQAINQGVGDIDVEHNKKVVRSQNSSIGNIHINN